MNNLFTFSDLCAGIGGFRLGLESIGGECVYSAEFNDDCEKTYFANYGHSFDFKDVTKIDAQTFPYVDVFCAGFPCQPFSIAGNRKGFNDSRGEIFFKLAELIQISQPKVVFLENVVNLVKIEKGRVMRDILSILDEIGYNVSFGILDSSDFGVAQARKRVYIIGKRKDLGSTPFLFTRKTSAKIGFKTIIEKGDFSIPISDKWQTYIDLYTGKIKEEEIDFEVPKTRKRLERADNQADLFDCVLQIRSSGIRALSIDKPLPTFAVSVSGGGAMIPVYTGERRHLNLIEMRRLMGFPDDFKFPVSRTNAIKQLANAVCPPVIESIGNDILKQVEFNSVLEVRAIG
ncbi:DNA (cytosine-5-)-methyltransferase [Flagellimonas sp. HMM57]|uniref:DNA cytosine methyltransferase n=1 Tax=unclassified Flagellimonas TaxID=2644544 RepID=UPI0013D0C3CB|nr:MULTISPECIES: DNA (cytosine-5-)-methyltransferase [unclassified Flagellimonas]UII75177.1 DNA (cytosine-5-)-methyltransferase [Flagellimonas sp. HMM57]